MNDIIKTLPREPWRGSQYCGYQTGYTAPAYCAERKAHGLAYCREHHLEVEMQYGEVRMAPGNVRGDASAPLALLWEPWDALEPVQPTADEIAAYAATEGGA